MKKVNVNFRVFYWGDANGTGGQTGSHIKVCGHIMIGGKFPAIGEKMSILKRNSDKVAPQLEVKMIDSDKYSPRLGFWDALINEKPPVGLTLNESRAQAIQMIIESNTPEVELSVY